PPWVIIGLCGASVLGAVIGVTAYPAWWLLITGTAVVQVLISLAGLWATDRPVLWAGAVRAPGWLRRWLTPCSASWPTVVLSRGSV
ncbi:MAG TPA: hypothetical protein VK060_12720, partial [Ruania sp.]|nr:hypothetical protein [Ruania sp.]